MDSRNTSLLTTLSQPLKIVGLLILSLMIAACGGGGGGDNGDQSGPVTAIPHQLDLYDSPLGAGVLIGEGDYEDGKVVSVSATPTTDYQFVNWTDGDGKVISEDPSFDITMDQSYYLTANFRLIPTLSAVSMPPNGAPTGFEVGDSSTDSIFVLTTETTVDDTYHGVWRSIDGGDTWSQVIIGEIDFVEVATANSDLVIAGIEDAYALSTDGGATWSNGVIHETSFGTPMSFSDASITASGNIFLATTDVMSPGLYLSTDAGANWSHIFTEAMAGNTREAQLSSVEVSTTDPDVIYTATLWGDNLWKSVDAGSSFFSIRSGLSNGGNPFNEGLTLDRDNADNLLVVENLTVNGGANWSQHSNVRPDNTIWLDSNLVRFGTEFSDFQHRGYAEISRDNGASWNRFMPLVFEDGTTMGGISDVYLSGDSVYLAESNSQIFRVELQMMRDRIEAL